MGRSMGRLAFATNASDAPIFAPFRSFPADAPCEELWAKTRAVRWLNESVPMPPSPLDGAIVDVTRFSYDMLGENGCDGGGYGCWFFLTPGFGSRIKLGRVIELENKRALLRWIAASVSWPRTLWYTLKCDVHPQCAALMHSDTGVCAAAALSGVDTVVVGADEGHVVPEVVICSPWCTQTVSCDECPAVEYAPGCVCRPGFGVSNCHNRTAPRPPLERCDNHVNIARVVLHRKLRVLGLVLSPGLLPLAIAACVCWRRRRRRRCAAGRGGGAVGGEGDAEPAEGWERID
jgi:hypothetical protein